MGEPPPGALTACPVHSVIEGIQSYFPALAGLPEAVLVVRGRSIKNDPTLVI